MSDIIEENSEILTESEPEREPERAEQTEQKPFLVASSKIDGNLQKKLSAPLLIYCRIAMAVGIPLVILYIVLSVLRDEELLFIPSAVLYVMLFLGAVLFATGIVFLFTVKKNVKNADKVAQIGEYSFFEDYVSVSSIRYGERMGAAKMYYTDFYKIREGKKFFLLYPNSVTVFPVPKEGISEEETVHLRNALRIIKK